MIKARIKIKADFVDILRVLTEVMLNWKDKDEKDSNEHDQWSTSSME